MKLNYGIIGTGMMGCEHIRNLKKIPNVDVVAIADHNKRSREWAKQTCGETFDPVLYTSYEELLSKDNIDVVVVASPNHTHIDVMRRTDTDCDMKVEKRIEDLWTDEGSRELSIPWTGKTVFWLLRHAAPKGYEYVLGRKTRIQKNSGRTPMYLTEVWRKMDKKEREKAQLEWIPEGKRRDAARLKRGVPEIVPDEDKEYADVMAKARQALAPPPAPAMPVFRCQQNGRLQCGESTNSKQRWAISAQKDQSDDSDAERKRASELSDNEWNAIKRHRAHQPKFTASGEFSEAWYAMVHTPVDVKKAYKIPEAKAAIDKESDKLLKMGAWDLSTVMPRKVVQERAKKSKNPTHFGNLMELCHQKHSELIGTVEEWKVKYKGRVVFRGDRVKDEYGHLAVFTDQTASASHMAAAKFMDVAAHLF